MILIVDEHVGCLDGLRLGDIHQDLERSPFGSRVRLMDAVPRRLPYSSVAYQVGEDGTLAQVAARRASCGCAHGVAKRLLERTGWRPYPR